jgi:CheY-like chemotaxis protein
MLADEDADHIRNFKTYIRLMFPESKIVAASSNPAGFTALAAGAAPQLIIADIRFFGAHFYRMARDAHDALPNARFIMYGSIDDEEYVRKITEFGVIDYLYKPVRPRDFERAMREAGELFEGIETERLSREALSAASAAYTPIFRDKFLQNLMRGKLSNEGEIRHGFEYFGMKLKPDYIVALVQIVDFRKIALALSEQDKHLLVYRVYEIIRRESEGAEVFLRSFNEFGVLIGGGGAAGAVSLVRAIRSQTLNEMKLDLNAGIGRPCKSPADIYISGREAEAAFRYCRRAGFGEIVDIDQAEPDDAFSYRYPHEKETALVYAAAAGDGEYCRELIGQISRALERSEPLPDGLVSKTVMSVVVSLNRLLSWRVRTVGERFSHFFPTDGLISVRTPLEAETYLKEGVRTLCEYINAARKR